MKPGFFAPCDIDAFFLEVGLLAVPREPEEAMNARDAILAAIRNNVAQPAAPLPEVPGLYRKGVKHGQGYKEHFSLNDLDVGVVRSPLGVAEAGESKWRHSC